VKIILSLAALLFGLATLLFIGLVLIAEVNCPIGSCRGPDGDIWMGAYIVGIFYLPVLAVVILFALVAKVARSNAK